MAHGFWKHRKSWDYHVCSVCSFEEKNPGNYCPNCGAKMDGDEEPEVFDIYWSDLTEECRWALIDAVDDMDIFPGNYDVFPIATIEIS